jgi:hypothetical protein
MNLSQHLEILTRVITVKVPVGKSHVALNSSNHRLDRRYCLEEVWGQKCFVVFVALYLLLPVLGSRVKAIDRRPESWPPEYGATAFRYPIFSRRKDIRGDITP